MQLLKVMIVKHYNNMKIVYSVMVSNNRKSYMENGIDDILIV